MDVEREELSPSAREADDEGEGPIVMERMTEAHGVMLGTASPIAHPQVFTAYVQRPGSLRRGRTIGTKPSESQRHQRKGSWTEELCKACFSAPPCDCGMASSLRRLWS